MRQRAVCQGPAEIAPLLALGEFKCQEFYVRPLPPLKRYDELLGQVELAQHPARTGGGAMSKPSQLPEGRCRCVASYRPPAKVSFRNGG